MKTFAVSLSFLSLSLSCMAQYSLQLSAVNLPPSHPADAPVYIAGNFNGWNPADEKFKMKQDGQGSYILDLLLPAGSYEYKLTRGSWENVECSSNGSSIANRQFIVENEAGKKILDLSVPGWADHFKQKTRQHTASKNVCVIDTALWMPQLNRSRRVAVYLPADYCDGNNKKYPVIYVHDGQNVFDEALSFSGEWGIDDFLDSTALPKSIVVAIDNGGNRRLNEYNPYDHPKFGKGEGNAYVTYIVKTLKPFIDKNYRTLRSREHTFIGGSSMGGLISLYAVLKYPKTFGGAAVFSPSFWISGDQVYKDILSMGKKLTGKIYLSAGKLEGETMVPDMLRATDALNKVSKAEVTTVIRDAGRHNEAAWRTEFPEFYKWVIGEGRIGNVQ